jgi:putative peptidoglycan lipid II flippase
MWPSVIAGSAVQINVLVSSNFASGINGGQTWLFCAFRLAQLPIGIFGVALATATLPAVTRAHARGDLAAFGATVRDSLRLAWFLALPAAAGLAALAHPIISLIYQHGRFSAHDAAETASALQAYAVGLAGYTAIRVLVPCFYALGLPRTPLRISLIGIGLNLVLNFANLYAGLGVVGLALITSTVALINFLQLIVALGRRVDLGGAFQWALFLARCAVAAGLCGGAAFGINHAAEAMSHERLPRAFGLGCAMTASVLVYFGAARVLRLGESAEAWAMIRRRLPGRR